VALDPVSTSFGAVPAANGKVWTKTIAMSQLGGSTGAVTAAVSGSGAFTADYANGVITVTFTPRDGGYGPQHAKLTVSDASGVIATSRLFAWGM